VTETTAFTDMFSYTPAGQVAGKLLQVTKTQPLQNLNTHQMYTQTAVGDLNLAYTYNNEGKVTQVTYPLNPNTATAPTFNYSYDPMMRLAGMSDQSNYGPTAVTNVTYNAANQLTSINYYSATETRSYNSMFQLTNITTSGQGLTGINVSYNYASGANNGKIASTSDAISGETVTYQYDSLNRLISASGSGWGQTQAYDGFGNLTGRTGTGTAQSTTISTPANPANNQLSGYTYDANGNLLSTGYGYDAENRMAAANGGAVVYYYDGQNKRIWQAACNEQATGGSCPPFGGWVLATETITMFGADGKQIGNCTPSAGWNNATTQQVAITFGCNARIYFGGKLVATSYSTLQATVQDRLGSVGKYYPYGEERNSPQLPNDQVKFATYTRDSATGNDYADQRYYSSALGRFMTPDPYRALASATNNPAVPQSWNRFTYVLSDPINLRDHMGLCGEPPDEEGSLSADDCDPGEPGSEPPGQGPPGTGASGTQCGPTNPGNVTLTAAQKTLLGNTSFSSLTTAQQIVFLVDTADASQLGLNLSDYQYAGITIAGVNGAT